MDKTPGVDFKLLPQIDAPFFTRVNVEIVGLVVVLLVDGNPVIIVEPTPPVCLGLIKINIFFAIVANLVDQGCVEVLEFGKLKTPVDTGQTSHCIPVDRKFGFEVNIVRRDFKVS